MDEKSILRKDEPKNGTQFKLRISEGASTLLVTGKFFGGSSNA